MRLPALVGPTAAGKTRIAMSLAPSLGAEVISIDSMQVYRGMDVGTAKPTPAEQRRVPHHLIDLVEPGAAFNVAEFQAAATTAVDGVRARGRTPLLVGGSGLYFRAIVDGLEFPPADATVRARIDRRATHELLRELEVKDPAAAARTQGNHRRIVRALEVIEITGRTFSSFRTAWDRFPSGEFRVAGLRVPAPVLIKRIEGRVREMLAGPLQEEAERLAAAGHRPAIESAAAIGYRQALAVAEGRTSVEEAVAAVVGSTRALARRQMSWFRRDPRIVWFDASDLEDATRAVGAYWSAESLHHEAAGGS